MTWKQFLELFRNELKKELSVKTSWGRKELESIIDKVCINVLCKVIDISKEVENGESRDV